MNEIEQVICVYDGPNVYEPRRILCAAKLGAIYTIVGVCPKHDGWMAPDGERMTTFHLAEIKPPSDYCCWTMKPRFRPVRRTDISALRELLTSRPTPELVCEAVGEDIRDVLEGARRLRGTPA